MKKDIDTIFRFKPEKFHHCRFSNTINFRRLKTIKQKLNKQMPEAYTAVAGAETGSREEDDEYDVAIRRRKLQVRRVFTVSGIRIS